MPKQDPKEARILAAQLGCWSGPVFPRPITGGITNANFLVEDAGERFFVRIGGDIALHGVMRFNERAATRAAGEAGLSPEVVHTEDGAMVLRFIEGRSLDASDVRDPETLARILALVRKCHCEVPRHLRGPSLVFWVFHVIRDYAHTLAAAGSHPDHELARYREFASRCEEAVGPVEIVFGHNDMLPANFIDDGERLWLVDWDYAGWGSPLFDLGGLASNSELTAKQEEWLLESYFERAIDDSLRLRYAAMKCVSLLREAMWSMVSEVHSDIDFDYPAYTETNLARFEKARAHFEGMG